MNIPYTISPFVVAAGADVVLSLPEFRRVRLLESSASSGLQAAFNRSDAPQDIAVGISFPAVVGSGYVRLRNTSGVEIVGKLITSLEEVQDTRVSFTGSGIPTTELLPDEFAGGSLVIAAASSQTLAARSTRRAVILQNVGAADAYLGSSSGLSLAPGAALTLPTAAAVQVWSTVGTTVEYLELY